MVIRPRAARGRDSAARSRGAGVRPMRRCVACSAGGREGGSRRRGAEANPRKTTGIEIPSIQGIIKCASRGSRPDEAFQGACRWGMHSPLPQPGHPQLPPGSCLTATGQCTVPRRRQGKAWRGKDRRLDGGDLWSRRCDDIVIPYMPCQSRVVVENERIPASPCRRRENSRNGNSRNGTKSSTYDTRSFA